MTNVTNNTQGSRYELMIDGHLCVADYQLDGVRLVITHVEVPGELRGRGIAAQVMEGVVADARARGLTIIPVCSYAATYMQRHPQ
jgi:predicted GNAT family acetyltransferase